MTILLILLASVAVGCIIASRSARPWITLEMELNRETELENWE